MLYTAQTLNGWTEKERENFMHCDWLERHGMILSVDSCNKYVTQ